MTDTKGIKKEVVNFRNKELEKHVREKIKKSEGDIYNTDFQGINVINLNVENHLFRLRKEEGADEIRINKIQMGNFDDFSLFPNLSKIMICALQVDANDLETMARLKSLSTLVFESYQILDVRALSSLTNLTVLDLSKNPISDKSLLDDLKKSGIYIYY